MELENLFRPGKIGSMEIKNRTVRSATFMRRAEKYGEIGDNHIDYYSRLAQGGVGLIITGFIVVDPSGSASSNQAALYNDSFIPGHAKLVNKVHDHDAKIAAQIAHTGRQGSHPKYPPIAPSPIPDKFTGLTPRKMSVEEIHQIIKKFADTARRAYESGYDSVQLHAAHGYLLSNFLSPYTNKRTDEFGGDINKRTRILIDIYNLVRDEVGKSFPIIIKLQTQDFVPNGLTLSEGKEITKILVDVGFDAIEPSGGIDETMIGTKNAYPSKVVKKKEDQNYFLPTALELKPLMKDSKLILMGGIKDPVSADQIIADGYADFISMSRPFIHEPDLVNRWKSGDTTPAKCVSCNSCYMTLLSGEVYCVVKKRLERRKKRKQNS
ncbi:MAG: NADH:flavin oxidoreductase [Candidatus Lokiarchaeota archaeon]|nr:NADH:flavin oxidoreductase [Candidatus Lokiarchaeota archaeon]